MVNVKLCYVLPNNVIMNCVSSLTMDLKHTLILQWQLNVACTIELFNLWYLGSEI